MIRRGPIQPVHVPWPRDTEHTRVTSVILTPNWRELPNHVYVGMPGKYTRAHGIPDVAAIYGKPWACLDDPRGWRYAYRRYLLNRMTTDEDFIRSVLALHGKTLVCFCKGSKRGADPDCHADLLASVCERMFHGLIPLAD